MIGANHAGIGQACGASAIGSFIRLAGDLSLFFVVPDAPAGKVSVPHGSHW
jgi:hypothetical protein